MSTALDRALEPGARAMVADMLEPPDGMTLRRGVLTSFTLDLATALIVPLIVAGHDADDPAAATPRERGFRTALRAAGRELHAREVGDFRYAVAREAARRLFDRTDPPDALFVADDHMAFAALDVARHEFGLDVPSDVAVIGYDDVAEAAWPSFDLTTVRQDLDAMVASATELLVAAMTTPTTGTTKLSLTPTLRERSTTRR